MTGIERPRGTLDWLPPRGALRQHVIDTAIETFERAGFRQIITPVFEDTALFARTAGETSDVVSKEMYSFHDRSDRPLTLRPEGTAPVVRAYLEHGLSREPQPVRLWYVAPMYRYAAPQAGRYREH
jgi:histidyl-tRNA synthetase